MIILNGHSCDNFLITTKRVSSAEGNSLSIMVDGKEFDKSKSYVIAEIAIPSNKVYSLTEMLSKGFISFFKSDNEEELNNLFAYAFNPFSKSSCFEYITMISEYNPDVICKDTTTYKFDKSFSCEENIFIPKAVPGFNRLTIMNCVEGNLCCRPIQAITYLDSKISIPTFRFGNLFAKLSDEDVKAYDDYKKRRDNGKRKSDPTRDMFTLSHKFSFETLYMGLCDVVKVVKGFSFEYMFILSSLFDPNEVTNIFGYKDGEIYSNKLDYPSVINLCYAAHGRVETVSFRRTTDRWVAKDKVELPNDINYVYITTPGYMDTLEATVYRNLLLADI